MSNDRVSAVYDLGVITALIEHTHIQSQHICEIDSTAGTAFIRADDHHVVTVDLKLLLVL